MAVVAVTKVSRVPQSAVWAFHHSLSLLCRLPRAIKLLRGDLLGSVLEHCYDAMAVHLLAFVEQPVEVMPTPCFHRVSIGSDFKQVESVRTWESASIKFAVSYPVPELVSRVLPTQLNHLLLRTARLHLTHISRLVLAVAERGVRTPERPSLRTVCRRCRLPSIAASYSRCIARSH